MVTGIQKKKIVRNSSKIISCVGDGNIFRETEFLIVLETVGESIACGVVKMLLLPF